MEHFSRYVGLDVHKDTIAVGVADGIEGEPYFFGTIRNTSETIRKLVKKMSPYGEVVSFFYEAGPCGYGLYRQITSLGHECTVVAPSLIPKKAGERVKTDPRDSVKLCRCGRSGDLTPVWVPDSYQEAMRDLCRAREDMKGMEKKARQRLSGYLLRQGMIYPGKSTGTREYFRWLETVKFENPVQQIVFQEYVDSVKDTQERVAGLVKEMEAAFKDWEMAPVVEGLMALRGVAFITAMTTVAELGDITRFHSPCQLMAYLGLVPSEQSSGQTRHRGGITKTGNSHVRRLLVESAWCYRYQARKTAALQRKADKASQEVQAIAWKAQKRLCGRFRRLINKGKTKGQVCTAIARELAGFMWAIACEVMKKSITSSQAA
jgi:transposase